MRRGSWLNSVVQQSTRLFFNYQTVLDVISFRSFVHHASGDETAQKHAAASIYLWTSDICSWSVVRKQELVRCKNGQIGDFCGCGTDKRFLKAAEIIASENTTSHIFGCNYFGVEGRKGFGHLVQFVWWDGVWLPQKASFPPICWRLYILIWTTANL